MAPRTVRGKSAKLTTDRQKFSKAVRRIAPLQARARAPLQLEQSGSPPPFAVAAAAAAAAPSESAVRTARLELLELPAAEAAADDGAKAPGHVSLRVQIADTDAEWLRLRCEQVPWL